MNGLLFALQPSPFQITVISVALVVVAVASGIDALRHTFKSRGLFGRLTVSRFSIRALITAVAISAVFLLFLSRVTERPRLMKQLGHFKNSLLNLKPTNPTFIDAGLWDRAIAATDTAFVVSLSSESLGKAQLHQLRDDLNLKLQGDIGVDTLEWLWERLAQTGRPGKHYAERNKPPFRQWFPNATPPVKP